MSAGSAAPSAGTGPVQMYDYVVRKSASEPVRVFQAGPLYYLVCVYTPPKVNAQVDDAARLQAADQNFKGCRTCRTRAVEYAPLIGPDGPVFLSYVDENNCDDAATVALCKLVREGAKNLGRKTVYPFVVTEKSFGPLNVGGSHHWTVMPESVTTDRARLFERAATVDYVDMTNSTMLTGLVATLLSGEGMFHSMELFSECLKKTSRGAGLYRGTTDWMLGVQTYAKETFPGRFWPTLDSVKKLHAVMYALGTSNLTRGVGDASSCPNYHQANNSVLGFLQNAHDLDSMVGLVNAQSDPLAYQRRTAPLTAGALTVGAGMLGPFKNTLCTLSQLPTQYSDQFVTWGTPPPQDSASSVSGYAAMRAALDKNVPSKLPGKALKASQFASRAGVKAGPTMTTVDELLKALSDGKPHKLTVDVSTHQPCVVVNTTLDTKKLRECQKHMWAFYPGQTVSSWGGTGATRVRALFRMPMGELLFVCDGLKPTNLGNCNFPEFLAPHMHPAKAVFEELNRTTSMEVPTLEPGDSYAAGFCASPQTEARTLYRSVFLVLDGVKHTLLWFEK